jgi:hypothetical protein
MTLGFSHIGINKDLATLEQQDRPYAVQHAYLAACYDRLFIETPLTAAYAVPT